MALIIMVGVAFVGQSHVFARQCDRVLKVAVIPYPLEDAKAQQMVKKINIAAAMDPCFKPINVNFFLENTNMPQELEVEKGKGLLAQGKKEFQSGDYNKAVKDLQQAATLLLNNYALTSMGKDAVEALMYLGIGEVFINKEVDAIKNFILAIRLDPTTDITMFTDSDEVKQVFNKAVDEDTAMPLVTLKVQTQPDGALVYVDGSFRGMSPLTLTDLKAGMHVVSFIKIGWLRESKVINLQPDIVNTIGPIKLIEAPKTSFLLSTIRNLRSGKVGAYVDAKGVLPSNGWIIVEIKKQKLHMTLFDLDRRSSAVQTMPLETKKIAVIRTYLHKLIGASVVKVPKTVNASNKGSIIKKWWFWTAIGAVVAGGVTAAVILSTNHNGRIESGFDKNGTGALIINF